MALEKKSLAECMLRKLKSQTIFKSRNNKENLIRSTAAKIKSMRMKCEADTANQLSNKAEVVLFLREFEYLKIHYEKRCEYIRLMKSSGSEIPVATIMEVMFNIVLTAMYTETWGELTDDYDGQGRNVDSDASYEATI